eukprot:131000_1
MKRIMRRAPLNHLNGSPVPSYISLPALHHFIQNYKTNPNEVYLISYPKSGEHLLQRAIIELIRHHSKEQTHPLYSQSETIPLKEHYISQNNAGAVDERNESLKDTFNFWWTHNPHSLFPANKDTLHPNTKYIVINRHPKDVLVSFWNWQNNLGAEWSGLEPKMSINDFLLRFISGTMYYGCYYRWTLDWFNAYKNDIFNSNNQMLWIYYEDFLCNPHETIQTVEGLLYDDDNNTITDSDLDDIVELTRFDTMKRDQVSNPQSFPFVDLYFRKGKEKDWMNHLNEQQSDLLDEIMWIKWAHTG